MLIIYKVAKKGGGGGTLSQAPSSKRALKTIKVQDCLTENINPICVSAG